MRRFVIIGATVAGLALLNAASASAQNYRASVGWNGGVLLNTSLNDGATAADLLDLKPDATWVVGGHYDHWFGRGNVGLYVRGAYSMPKLPWIQGDRKIRVYMGDLGVILRPIAPEAGRTVLPYISGGVGLIRWGLGDGPTTTYDPAGATFDGSEAFDLVAAGGLGFDIVTPWRWGEGPVVVRIEARDHVQFSSPFEPVNPEDGDFGLIHNAAVVLGFHTGVGILGGGG
jgi:hypothetical protein